MSPSSYLPKVSHTDLNYLEHSFLQDSLGWTIYNSLCIIAVKEEFRKTITHFAHTPWVVISVVAEFCL